MGKNLTALAVKLGMRYYEEQNLLFGRLSGYECAVGAAGKKKVIMLHVIARPAERKTWEWSVCWSSCNRSIRR